MIKLFFRLLYVKVPLQYLPFGELFISQRNDGFDSRYKFTAKELDNETSYTYFGARYYDSDVSVWLSVDPMSDERSWVSPYSYCQNSPLIRTDPTGALDWIPPTDGSGNWTAEKGDGAWRLSQQAGIPFDDANAAIKSANQNRGQARTSESMVYPGDVVNIESRPGYTWGSETSSSPATPTTSNTYVNSGNTAQTINTVTTALSLITGATQEIAKIPNVGYNIANNTTLLKGMNFLKPISYGLSGITVASDFYLSANGQQSWGETGANTVVTGVSIVVGGWPGLIIQTNYQASKLYYKTIWKHPEWAPYPIYAR